MKTVSAVILLLTISIATGYGFDDFANKPEGRTMRDKIKDLLENLKETLRTGNSSIGIPIIDPLVTDFQNVTLIDNTLSLDLNVSNAKVDGLSNYKVNDADFKFVKLNLTLNLTWPSIKLESAYDLNAYLVEFPDFPVFGNGDARAEAKDFTFATEILFNMENETRKLSVNTLSSKIALGAIDFKASGIYNDEEAAETASKAITAALPTAIDFHHSLFIGSIDAALTGLINNALRNHTLDSLLELLG